MFVKNIDKTIFLTCMQWLSLFTNYAVTEITEQIIQTAYFKKKQVC